MKKICFILLFVTVCNSNSVLSFEQNCQLGNGNFMYAEDPFEDVYSSTIDFVYASMDYSVAGDFTGTFEIDGIANPIDINRPGVTPGYGEYSWDFLINKDNSSATGASSFSSRVLGYTGADLIVSIKNWAGSPPQPAYIDSNAFQASLWFYNKVTNGWSYINDIEVYTRYNLLLDMYVYIPDLNSNTTVTAHSYDACPNCQQPYQWDILSDCTKSFTDNIFENSFQIAQRNLFTFYTKPELYVEYTGGNAVEIVWLNEQENLTSCFKSSTPIHADWNGFSSHTYGRHSELIWISSNQNLTLTLNCSDSEGNSQNGVININVF